MSHEKTVRVLLVDDERLVRSVVSRALHKQTANDPEVLMIAEALGGEAAFQTTQDAEEPVFHILITDCQMPGGDGPTLVKKLLEGPPGRCPQTIMIWSSNEHILEDTVFLVPLAMKRGVTLIRKTKDDMREKLAQLLDIYHRQQG